MITGAVLAGRIFWLDRRWSMVEQIFSGPFLRAEYLTALLLTTLLFSLVGVGIMALVALPLAGLPRISGVELLVILATIALGATFFGGLLIALGARIRSANLYFTIQSLLQYLPDLHLDGLLSRHCEDPDRTSDRRLREPADVRRQYRAGRFHAFVRAGRPYRPARCSAGWRSRPSRSRSSLSAGSSSGPFSRPNRASA